MLVRDVGAAEPGVQCAREQDAAGNVDAAPVAVQSDLGPAFGTEIGVGRPGDIAEQAGGEPDAAVARLLIGEQRRDPLGDRAAVRGEASKSPSLELRRDDQRILRPGRGVERLIEQPFAQSR